MRIDGEWALFDDGVMRPLVSGEILAAAGSWLKFPVLVDTGADRTVLTAVALTQLGLRPNTSYDGISGLGGMAESVVIETQVRLSRENSSKVVFRGQYEAVTEVQSLDMCVLGRDITALFAVIVDQERGVVCMLSQRHHYKIQVD
jgi:predicted aspartyl protease